MPLPEFTMDFAPTTIEHLGVKLYVTFAPVIGELISNAWDADAAKVEVTVPTGPITKDSIVVIRDYGNGMSAEEIQKNYLEIGRNCRVATGKDKTSKERAVMGHKGLGKLAAFGIADDVQITTFKDGGSISLQLNYEAMKAWPKGQPYKPSVMAARTGKSTEASGTEVRITGMRRKRPIEIDRLKREISRRFLVIGDGFKVLINGVEVTHKDRRTKEDCKKVWEVSELSVGGTVDATEGWSVTGWIGLVEKASQADRGVDIFARGKAAELDTMFNRATTHNQFARAYVVGEITAEFLDLAEDHISTSRNSVQWESDAGQKLQEWGSKAIAFVMEQWLEIKKTEKEQKIVRTADFDKWLKSRNSHEQKVANKLLKAIVDDENIEPDSAGPLLDIIKSNVEFQAFQELVDELEVPGAKVESLFKLFRDWRVIEAREHLKLSDGRLEVMERLSTYITDGALEVKQIQPLFEENGWLVNPTWGEVTGQTTYTALLRKNCVEPKGLADGDLRIDILGYEVGGTVHVVELKRPEKTLSRDDLEQIEKYVDWARANLVGTGPDAPKYVTGLLIVGSLGNSKELSQKMTRLAGSDIRVEVFRDLKNRAEKVYGEVENRLKKVAPEYSRAARKARKKAA